MGSRVRIAAAACLVASGLLAGGASETMAFADPQLTSGDSGDKHTNGSLGDGSAKKPESDPDEKKTAPGVGPQRGGTRSEHSGNVGRGKEEKPGTDPDEHKAGDEKDGDADNGKDGENGNGNGGNRGNSSRNNDDQNPDNGNCGNSGSNGNGSCGGGGGNDTDDPTPRTKPSTSQRKEEPPPPPDEPGDCDEKNDDHCSTGWPWPWDPGKPPEPGGGGGGGSAAEVPSGRPGMPPQMQLPPELMPPATEPVGPSVIDVSPGVGIAAAELPIPPITLPVIVTPTTGLGGGGSPGSPVLPATPRGVTAEPPAGREPLPANVGSNVAVPASSYRTGYTDYLRSAGLSQLAALAVPGVAGMLVLTGAGGLVGYRQAKAGRAVHTSGTARFVN